MLDNATINVTALECLEKQLLDIDPLFRLSEHCLQCFSHIFNLIVKAFVFGKPVDINIGISSGKNEAEATNRERREQQ